MVSHPRRSIRCANLFALPLLLHLACSGSGEPAADTKAGPKRVTVDVNDTNVRPSPLAQKRAKEAIKFVSETDRRLRELWTESSKAEWAKSTNITPETQKAAATANAQLQNIGARRLHTVLERVLDDLSFEASELGTTEIRITQEYVNERLGDLLDDQDLARHIL